MLLRERPSMRSILGCVLLILIPGLFLASVHQCVVFSHKTHIFYPFLAGTVLGVLFDHYVMRKIPGVGTFEHELTHAVAALLFFRRIRSFVVTRHRGGHVRHSGGFGGELADEFIGLAPYVLPTFTAASILARPLIPQGWFPWFDVGIGGTFGFHLRSTLRGIRDNWSARPFQSAGSGDWTLSDIARRGRLYSLIFIIAASLAIHGSLCTILVQGIHGLPDWWGDAWRVTREVISELTELVQALVELLRRAIASL